MTRPLFARTSKNREFVSRRETSGPFLSLIILIRSASLLPRSDSGERWQPSSRVDEALSRLKVCSSKCLAQCSRSIMMEQCGALRNAWRWRRSVVVWLTITFQATKTERKGSK